jgi:DNA modification methylase
MNKIEFGDCRETMRRWASEGVKVQTCVTSPPYYGLRDYGHDGQIGLEETPKQYIEAMVEVFSCVRDVLKDDGTLWINIADSWASTAQGTFNSPQKIAGDSANVYANFRPNVGLAPKNMIGIPWRLAFALQDDGWILRQDIIWHKPNPFPESVKDRCTKSHEYIFLLSKKQKYFYDCDAIREPAIGEFDKEYVSPKKDWADFGGRRSREVNNNGQSEGYAVQNTAPQAPENGRNKRSVWTIPTKPYEGAHFAVFPTDLIEPCILAGAPVGGVVLDPFMGSGTTAQVAQSLGRQYLGCELNPEYAPLQKKRLAQQSLILE